MCIIIAKEIGKSLPDIDLLKRCWEKNPHGGGYMFNANDKVIIKKGFMTFDDFYQSLMSTHQKYNLKNKALVIHFRIATSGAIDKGNCHPYPLTNEKTKLRKNEIDTFLGIAHNGIIRKYNHKSKILNDTQLFIQDILYELILNTTTNFYMTNVFKKIIESMINGSRLVFLNGNGEITKIGKWYEQCDLFFSNLSYKKNLEKKQKKIKLFDNELKYLDDCIDDVFLINDEEVEEDEFDLLLDSLTPLNKYESVYDCNYLEEYNSYNGDYYLDEEEKLIYQKIGNHIYFLGNYLTKEDYYKEFY